VVVVVVVVVFILASPHLVIVHRPLNVNDSFIQDNSSAFNL
jgi:hypothetical protein